MSKILATQLTKSFIEKCNKTTLSGISREFKKPKKSQQFDY